MKSGSLLVLCVLSGLTFSGCETGGGGAPSGGGASHGDPQIAYGRKLYVGRCTACHAPEPVLDYTLAEWYELMPEMAEESKMDAAQEAAVMAYVKSHF